jgi:hypothetical protein
MDDLLREIRARYDFHEGSGDGNADSAAKSKTAST